MVLSVSFRNASVVNLFIGNVSNVSNDTSLMLMKLLKDGSCCWWNMLMVDWPVVRREGNRWDLFVTFGWLACVGGVMRRREGAVGLGKLAGCTAHRSDQPV